MGVIKPALPDLDLDDWAARPEADRVRLMCESWAVQGFGAPAVAYFFYVAKIAVYVCLWVVFVSRAPDVQGWSDLGDWWATPIAFEKAILWTMLFEVLGLGCGSGPLTGRYVPPIVAFTHFLRPGTLRLPAFPDRVPLTAGHRRTVVDALLYAALLGLCLRALLSSEALLDEGLLVPIIAVLAVLGLRDKTIFLAARAEHYWTMLIVFALAGDDVTVLLAGAMVVQLAIWWGAASSKLNHHFPNVVTIMVSNSPVLRVPALKKAMYRHYPDDLRASGLAAALAHGGTVIEFAFPLLLAVSSGGTPTTVGLAVMLSFHLFITSCFPMGVPIEWNVLFVYSMFVLFGHYAELSPLDVFDDPLLAVALAVGHPGRPRLRQPPAGQGLVPARHALLRGQLGGQPLALPAWDRRGPGPEGHQDGEDDPEAAGPALRRRHHPGGAGQAAGLPLDAPPRAGPQRRAADGGRRSRGL